MLTKHNYFRTNVIRILSSSASASLVFLPLFFAVLCLFSTAAAENKSTTSTSLVTPPIILTEEEQTWLAEHPDIVLGIPTNYPPIVIKTPDDNYVGMAVDLFDLISQRLNTRIRLHIEDSWPNIQEKAKNKEIDGLALGGKHPTRSVLYNASDAVMSTYRSVFARSQNEFQLKKFSDLNGLRIGYKEAGRTTKSILEKLPTSILKPYSDNESMTQALLTKEVDILVAWASYDHWRRQKLQGTIDNILLIKEYPVDFFTHIRKDWPEFISILNKVIKSLQQEELPRIINKWFGQWPLEISVPRVSLTPEERAWLRAHPQITLGAPSTYPPMAIRRADGTHVGVLVDLFQQINRQLNTRIRLHIEDSWADIQEKAQDRKIDGLAFGGRDPDREVFYNPTDVVMTTYFSVFARSQHEYQLKSFSDLKGMRVGFKGAARPTRSLLETQPEIIKKPYDSHEAMTQALLAKEVDVLVAWMSYDHWRKDKLQGTIDNVLLIDEYPIEMVTHIRKDWPELVPILNKAIAALQQEELPRIINKWFGQWASAASKAPLTQEDKAWVEAYPNLAPVAFKIRERVQLNAEEREWLQSKTKIPVRVGDYPPFFFIADGTPQGVSIDYVQLVCMAHKLDCDYVQGLAITDSIPTLTRPGGIAIQPGWQKSGEREKVALFTGPYIDSPFVIFQREGSERVRSMEDLVGKRVVVEKNYAIHQLLKSQFPDLDLVEVEFSTQAIKRLAAGKVDAYVSSLMAGYYQSLAHGYPNIIVAAPAPFEPNRLEIAVRRDMPELASIVTKSIAAIRPEEHQDIRKRWLSINYQEKVDYTLLWQMLSAAGLARCYILEQAAQPKGCSTHI